MNHTCTILGRWLPLLLAATIASAAGPTNTALPLLSHFTFDHDTSDELGRSPSMSLLGTWLTNGTLFIPETPEFDYGASVHVSALSFRSFTIGLEFNPSVFDYYPHSTILSGGTYGRWFEIQNDADGHLILTLNNSSLSFSFTNVLQTNQWHSIVCAVDVPSQRIVTYLDAVRLPDIVLQNFKFTVASKPDADFYKDLSFWSGGNASRFCGYADNLRIFSRALTPDEIESRPSSGPTIFRQPKSVVAARSDNVVFSVDVQSSAPISYQWYKNGRSIPGADGLELMLRNVRPSMAGFYTVLACSAIGAVQSDIAYLAVYQPVRIVRPPTRQLVHEGESCTLRVRATGTGPFTYQWFGDGERIFGATTPVFTVPTVTKEDAGAYTVQVGNILGSVTSRAAAVVVINP